MTRTKHFNRTDNITDSSSFVLTAGFSVNLITKVTFVFSSVDMCNVLGRARALSSPCGNNAALICTFDGVER